MNLSPRVNKLLKAILKFSKDRKVKLYIVGGYLRDILLNRDRDNLDIDFCLKKGAINFGRKLAKQIKTGFVVLDRVRGACRLIKKIEDKTYTLDFTDFRGKTLEEDLLQRDFTINSLTIEFEKLLNLSEPLIELIDPYGGKKDLESKIVRVVNKKAFDEDPLRVMRAFSFACLFDFKIDKKTLKLIQAKHKELARVSGERLRDELFKILDSSCAFDYLYQMDRLKILSIIFPEIETMRNVRQGPYHHLDIWKHTLETIRQLEIIIQEFKDNQEIQGYLNKVISPGRKRRALIKLGAFLHDIGKPRALRHKNGRITFYGHERLGWEISEMIARRLRLSNDELDALKKMIFWHLRPGYLADNDEVSARAKFRYFRDTADEAVSVLLISLADQRATKGRLTTKTSRIQHEKVVSSLIKEYFRKKKEKKKICLINGDDLMRRFKLEPSPLIGKILHEVEELQAIGKIKSRREAFNIAKKFIKENM